MVRHGGIAASLRAVDSLGILAINPRAVARGSPRADRPPPSFARGGGDLV